MSNTNSPLIDAIVFQSTLCLQVNQEENFGKVDFERFQKDLSIHLESIENLEQELDNIIDELEKELVASQIKDKLLLDANEEIRLLKSLCMDFQGQPKSIHDFCLDHLN